MTVVPNKRGISALTTWHSQTGLLLISFWWGASYIVPPDDRIPFSEVFPDNLRHSFVPMWVWGVVLIVTAMVAWGAERVINRSRAVHSFAWRCGWISHALLAGAYGTLALAALIQSFSEVSGGLNTFHFWGNVISSVSRTVLWGFIAYLHSTYARLPRPAGV